METKQTAKVVLGMALLATLSLAALPALAGSSIQVTAKLFRNCFNCATPAGGYNPSTGDVLGGTYSVLPFQPDATDGDGGIYMNGPRVQSEILTHNTVYTLDTLDSLANGLVGGSTRGAQMLFYSVAQNPNTNPQTWLPSCWGTSPSVSAQDGNPDVSVAVNWSVFSDNQVAFTEMKPDGQTIYPGRARMDFNVRPQCDNQIFRFALKNWKVAIKRFADAGGKRRWEVVTPNGYLNLNYGEADLSGQGGRGKQTLPYGTFRLPFKMTLTEE